MQKLHILCRSFVLSHNNGLNNGNGFGCSHNKISALRQTKIEPKSGISSKDFYICWSDPRGNSAETCHINETLFGVPNGNDHATLRLIESFVSHLPMAKPQN